jgi:hypothetical protein
LTLRYGPVAGDHGARDRRRIPHVDIGVIVAVVLAGAWDEHPALKDADRVLAVVASRVFVTEGQDRERPRRTVRGDDPLGVARPVHDAIPQVAMDVPQAAYRVARIGAVEKERVIRPPYVQLVVVIVQDPSPSALISADWVPTQIEEDPFLIRAYWCSVRKCEWASRASRAP